MISVLWLHARTFPCPTSVGCLSFGRILTRSIWRLVLILIGRKWHAQCTLPSRLLQFQKKDKRRSFNLNFQYPQPKLNEKKQKTFWNRKLTVKSINTQSDTISLQSNLQNRSRQWFINFKSSQSKLWKKFDRVCRLGVFAFFIHGDVIQCGNSNETD